MCYYCRRVWRANYSASFSLEKFIPQCAQNKSMFGTFSSLVSFAIDKMATAGSHDVTIRKSDFDATAEDCAGRLEQVIPGICFFFHAGRAKKKRVGSSFFGHFLDTPRHSYPLTPESSDCDSLKAAKCLVA